MRFRLALVCSLFALTALPALASNDPMFSQQYALNKISAEGAWTIGTGNGVRLAVIDSGADLTHEDLAPKFLTGYDFVDNDANPADENGHGTHVSGIAAAVTGNGLGIAGTAPDACIMPVRVLDDEGSGSVGGVQAGIRWAVESGASVINLSLGEDVVIRNVEGSSIQGAIEDAWREGVVIVVAAGNDAVFPSGYGDIHAVIVGATDRRDERAIFSNLSDARWSMVAPGQSIISTLPGNRYGTESGTSMAAPHVAGAAAVLRGLGLSRDATIDRLLSTADDLGPPGTDPVYGSGRLNLSKAVKGETPKTTKQTCKVLGSGNSGTASPATGTRPANSTSGGSGPTTNGDPSQPANGATQPPGGPASGADDPGSPTAQESSDPKSSLAVNIVLASMIGLGLAASVVWSRLRARRH